MKKVIYLTETEWDTVTTLKLTQEEQSQLQKWGTVIIKRNNGGVEIALTLYETQSVRMEILQ